MLKRKNKTILSMLKKKINNKKNYLLKKNKIVITCQKSILKYFYSTLIMNYLFTLTIMKDYFL